jgi:hypothetical protein
MHKPYPRLPLAASRGELPARSMQLLQAANGRKCSRSSAYRQAAALIARLLGCPLSMQTSTTYTLCPLVGFSTLPGGSAHLCKDQRRLEPLRAAV